MTALHHACKTSVKCATYFLCAEANVLLKDCRGDTALHTGLKWLKEERLVPLIEKFVQLDSKLVDEPNNEGETCLSLAVVRGNNLEALQKLATKKSVNLQRKKGIDIRLMSRSHFSHSFRKIKDQPLISLHCIGWFVQMTCKLFLRSMKILISN